MKNTIGLTIVSSIILCGFTGDVRIKTPSSGAISQTVSGGILAPPVAFSPASLPNLEMWLDAADTSTITDTSGAVTQWDDKSGNGFDVAQSSPPLRPTTNASTQNGHNVIDFSDSVLELVADGIAQPLSVFIVHVHTDLSGTSGTEYPFRQKAAGSSFIMRKVAVANTMQWRAGTTLTTDDAVTSGYHAWEIRANGASSTLYLDGVAEDTGDPGTNGFEPILMGGQPDAAQPLVGSIAEFFVVTGTITAATRGRIQTYFEHKWGI